MQMRQKWMLLVMALSLLTLCGTASAEQCPTKPLCRDPASEYLRKILQRKKKPTDRDRYIWATTCGPNTEPPREDLICKQISVCPAAGAFGLFLNAVMFQCKSKHFDGYFGLDGMTFGILDWPSNNLPRILRAYQDRNATEFNALFGNVGVPMENGCLDPDWVCNNNRTGKLMCEPNFHTAFAAATRSSDFQKAEIELALQAYEGRIKGYASLGLKTDYGTIAMVVLANNLVDNAECKPASWKEACADQTDETHLVRCMMAQYVSHRCRGGDANSSEERVLAFEQAFAKLPSNGKLHPTADEVISCSADWGKLEK